jgi:ubiquinone/menaquinone biosynthesis C-methylase UbiE
LKNITIKQNAWDCGTGNGQVAKVLAKHFDNVFATDISAAQLDQAERAANIHYSVTPAEKTSFDNKTFDLITVAQALHWFNLPEFYSEVQRVGKPGATIAVWGYSFITISPEVDPIILDFYQNIVGPYWDSARKLVEEEYASVPFPFHDVTKKKFAIQTNWSLPELSGYLESWSATQKYIKAHQHNPVPLLTKAIAAVWKEEIKPISFPVFVLKGNI